MRLRGFAAKLGAGALLVMPLFLQVGGVPVASAQEPPATEVTVVMTELDPFVINDDGKPDGFYAEIWDEVALSLGVRYETLWVDSFVDLLTAIENGDADIAIAPLAPTAAREEIFDFTSAVIRSGPQIGFSDRLDTRPSLLRSILDPRVLGLAGIAILGLLVVAHIMWLLERKRHDSDGDFHKSYLRGIWDGLWWSTVTATTVGYGDKAPKSFGGRLVALIVMLASLVLVGAFVSQVTAIMAEDLNAPAIESLEDVSGEVGVVAGSSFADFLSTQGVDIQPYASQAELFDAVRSGEIDVLVTNPFALGALDARDGVITVEGVLYEEFETFGLAQGSPWREPVNQALAGLQASGVIAEIVKDGLN